MAKPGTPDSATVGTFGSNGSRCAEATAIARNEPDFTFVSTPGNESNIKGTRPAITSIMDVELPLYGT